MTDKDTITLPREVVQLALEAFEAVMPFSTTQRELKIRAVDALRKALAAEQPKHPGYIIGSHWLETAYSRICAGEAEADVLRDCGWERVDEALRRDAERLREALAWAYNLRHLRGHSDPVVIPERFAPLIEDALRREDGA